MIYNMFLIHKYGLTNDLGLINVFLRHLRDSYDLFLKKGPQTIPTEEAFVDSIIETFLEVFPHPYYA